MRTTLTLDRDVASRLEKAARRQKRPLETVINDALRAGLEALDQRAAGRERFQTSGLDLGPSRVGSLDDVEGVLARADGRTSPRASLTRRHPG